MVEVIIDTNFLLTCAKQKVDLFEDLGILLISFKAVIPAGVISELKKLRKDKKLKIKEREAANLALQILAKENIRKFESEQSVDDAIVSYALKNKGVLVATLDRGIKKRLNKKVKFITLRQKKRLVFA